MRNLAKKHAVFAGVLLLLTTGFTSAAWAAAKGNGVSSLARPTVASSPILIGDICDCTGIYSGGFGTGIDVWMKWVNAHGGIDGHQVKVLEEDTQSNQANVLSEVKQLIENDHVVAIFPGTFFVGAFAPLVEADNIPEIGGPSNTPTYSTSPVFFPATTGAIPQIAALVNVIAGAGRKKIGNFTVVGTGPYFTTLVTPVAKKARATFLLSEELADGAPNYSAQCLAMRNAGVNGILLTTTSNVDIRAAQDCAAQGYHPQYAATVSLTNAALSTPALGKTLIVEPDAPFFAKSSAISQFDTAMQKYEPKFFHSSQLGEPQLVAWTSGLLLQAAVQAAKPKGAVTSADVTEGLYKLHGVTLGGLAPPLTFKPNTGHTISCYFIGQIRHGTFVAPYGTKLFCPSS